MTRSDKGKKRKTYAGKPVRKRNYNSSNFVPYVKTRKKDDPIKIMIYETKDMSYDGYKRWARKLRGVIYKKVFYPVKLKDEGYKDYVLLVYPQDISNIEKLQEFAVNVIGYPGKFDLRMITPRKNKHFRSFCKKADIIIKEHPEGLNASIHNYSKLNKYWFFKG